MVVSHLDVCSELVALAVRCGAGPDADAGPPDDRARPSGPAAARRTGARRGIGDSRIRHGGDNVFRRARPLGVN